MGSDRAPRIASRDDVGRLGVEELPVFHGSPCLSVPSVPTTVLARAGTGLTTIASRIILSTSNIELRGFEMTEEARVSTRASADDERVPSKSARVSTMGWLSFFTMFAIGTDTFLVAPLLPLLQRELDVPLSRAGWLVSAYALGYALFALVAGPVSDRHDRRRVILSGLAAFAVLTCACGLVWSFWSMVAARFLAGVSAAFVSSQIWPPSQ